MRIVGGDLKGRVILTSKNLDYRPTKSIAKEMIFNVLAGASFGRGNFIKDSSVLDLFCGSGILGIESLSRGARNATFVDINKESVSLLQANISRLDLINRSNIIVADALKMSMPLRAYDIIFADPPYNLICMDRVANNILSSDCLNEGGVLIAEVASEAIVDLPPSFNILKEKKFGKSKFLFCSLED